MSNLKRVIALGFFDGVHLGHKALMECANLRARQKHALSAVFTFDIHPTNVVSKKRVPFIVSPTEREMEIIRLGKVDEVIFARFDENMRKMHWKDFVTEVLFREFGAVHIITGHNNRFGYMGEGNAENLREHCKTLGIGYDCIEDIKVDDTVVSSTLIRKFIAEGDMLTATRFLGHPYTISGAVTHGRKVGRTLGIPTINLPLPEEMQKPPFGVYASQVIVGDKRLMAVTNIGLRPTFLDKAEPTVEPHIIDFEGYLYGKNVHIELYKFLRPEMKFENTQQLKEAIDENIQQTREFFDWGAGLS